MSEESDESKSSDGSEGSEHSSVNNLEDALEMYENQYDRIDHEQERLIDRGDRYFRRYLYSTSILAGFLSLGPVTLPSSLCVGLWMGSAAFLANGLCIKKYREFIRPRDFIQLKYELENEGAMLSKQVLRESREDFLGSMVKRFNENVKKYNKKVHGEDDAKDGLSGELKELHQWIFIAIGVNILLVVLLVVI